MVGGAGIGRERRFCREGVWGLCGLLRGLNGDIY